MARRKNKKPSVKEIPQGGKQPKISSHPQSFRGGVMSWRFNAVDKNGPFAWTNLSDGKEFKQVIEKLSNLETMSEADQQLGGCHFISVEKLSKEAGARLTEIRLDDLDELYSIRLEARGRVFCVHRRQYMRVLWFDPDHEVCPSKPKNT